MGKRRWVSAFKWRQFAGEVILWAVRWYCRYGISCGFRRCRSVIPRSCRSLFRHDVARLGVLLVFGFWREASCGSILYGGSRSSSSQAVAGEIDAMGVVDEAVEDGISVGRVADDLVPFVDRDLAGKEG